MGEQCEFIASEEERRQGGGAEAVGPENRVKFTSTDRDLRIYDAPNVNLNAAYRTMR